MTRLTNIKPAQPSQGAVTHAIGAIVGMVQPAPEQLERSTENRAHGWIMRIMDAEGPAILHMLKRILGVDADVMDAFQECFCRLATRTDGKNLTRAKAYVYRTAANIAVEMIRTRTRHRAHVPAIAATAAIVARRRSESLPDDGSSREAEVAELREAIAQLPTHLRNVVVLRDLGRLSYREVGQTLGIGPATARVYRRHAVVMLSGLLGEGERL